jgi:hypothetical protein
MTRKDMRTSNTQTQTKINNSSKKEDCYMHRNLIR